tara:strand:+ start:22390 stop:24084 length:1695 start_codon:yes stop_codon:yes gene_type:complete
MKLKLRVQSKSELFDIQRSLIKTISLAAAAVVLVSGTAIQLFVPNGSTMGNTHRIFFVILFCLAAYMTSKKTKSYRIVESGLALAGSAFLTRMVVLYYESGLTPIHIVVCVLAVVGLSGVFIYKTSLVILNLPSLAFIFYTTVHLPPNPNMPSELGIICLICAAIVGYFLTWQKVFLINKSVALELHKNIVMANLHEGVSLLNQAGEILTLNQAMSRVVGLTTDEILNHHFLNPQWSIMAADGVTPLHPEQYPSTVARLTGKTIKNFPVIVKKPDHTVSYLELTANPIFHAEIPNQVEFVLLTCRDITELKKAQEEIENQKLHTLAHSKLTALGEMAAGIAHEINNPLTIILGRVEHVKRLIEENKISPSEMNQTILKIESTTLRISKIVKSMRSLSRENNTNEFVRTNLRGIIDDIVTVSSDNLKQHEIKIEIDLESMLEIDCNPGLLSQVFINLINNSVDAIKDQNGERWIRLNSQIADGMIKISFSDSGNGIPAVIKDKIMLPFFTTKEAGKGTGIGLSLCRTIVENHKGRFYIDESKSNTCFGIDLPIKHTQKPKISPAS